MNTSKIILAFLSVVLFLGLSGCERSSNDGSVSQTGSLSARLTDAPGDYSAVYVTVNEILVHKAGSDESEDNSIDSNESSNTGWTVIAEPHKTYNLLALTNGISEELGEANISTGKYTQMRLVLGNEEDNGTNILGNPHPYANYLIFVSGSDVAALTVPSNVIKQNHNFEMLPDAELVLMIDFDANESIVEKGNGTYSLKPVLGLVVVTESEVISPE